MGTESAFWGTRWRASCAEQWRELCTRWLASCAARCFRGKRADSHVVLDSLARASRALRSLSAGPRMRADMCRYAQIRPHTSRWVHFRRLLESILLPFGLHLGSIWAPFQHPLPDSIFLVIWGCILGSIWDPCAQKCRQWCQSGRQKGPFGPPLARQGSPKASYFGQNRQEIAQKSVQKALPQNTRKKQ